MSGRGFQLSLVTIAVSATAYALAALGPLQETMQRALAFSDNQMALLQGATRALPLMITAVPLGILVDRCSRVRLLIAFAAIVLAASLGTAVVYSFAMLFLFRCVVGFGWAATLIASISLAADLYPPARRGRATMVMGIGQVGGASAAFALGGTLLRLLGSKPTDWTWALIWLISPLVPALLCMLMLREPIREGVGVSGGVDAEKLPVTRAFRELWRLRPVIGPLLGGLVIVDVAFGAAYLWAAPVFSRRFNLSPDRVGAIMGGVLLLSGILGPLAGGVLADTCQRAGGPRRSLAVLCGLAVASVPLGAFAVVTGVAFSIALLATFLTIVPAISLMTTTLCTIVVPNELRGLGIALLNAASVLFGYVLAPLAVSLLSSVMGGPLMLGKAVAAVCATACALGGGIFALGMRYFPHPERGG